MLRMWPMKRLHRDGFYGWSSFDEARNLDFNGVLWVRSTGNVVIDPVVMSAHDQAHLDALGGAAWIVVTNSDHVRDAGALAARTGARTAGPAGERDSFPVRCDLWLADGDELPGGGAVLALEGSKTPGELALWLEGDTLVTGDLVRAHGGGRLDLLPAAKLRDPAAALASLARLCALPVEAVLVGDGWPVFRDGRAHLEALVATL